MTPTSYPFNNGTVNVGIAGTLAALAYCQDVVDSVPNALSGWTVPWRADQSVDGNYAYIAATTNQFVVAIRGSETDFSWDSFYNWIEQDLNVLRQVLWQYPSDGTSRISWGSSLALGNLQQLVDSRSGSEVTMLDFLLTNAVANGTPIVVTGHSLGGNLSTVVAPWLAWAIGQANKTVPQMGVYTFAAPSAGNASFAQNYDTLFGSSSWRFYNQNDIVPFFSNNVLGLASLWSPAPEAISISTQYNGHTVTLAEFFIAIAGGIAASEALYRSWYTQTNATQGTVELNTAGTINPSYTQNTLTDWLDQAAWQHSMQTYLSLLGAAGTTCVTAGNDMVARDAGAHANPRTLTALLDTKLVGTKAASAAP